MRIGEGYFFRTTHAPGTRSANSNLWGYSWPVQRPSDDFQAVRQSFLAKLYFSR